MDGDNQARKPKEASKKRGRSDGEETATKTNKRAKVQSKGPPIIPRTTTAVPLPTASLLSAPKSSPPKKTNPVSLSKAKNQSPAVHAQPQQSPIPAPQVQTGAEVQPKTSNKGKEKEKRKSKGEENGVKPSASKDSKEGKRQVTAQEQESQQSQPDKSSSKKKQKSKQDKKKVTAPISEENKRDKAEAPEKHQELQHSQVDDAQSKEKRKSKRDENGVKESKSKNSKKDKKQAAVAEHESQQSPPNEERSTGKRKLSDQKDVDSPPKSKKRRKDKTVAEAITHSSSSAVEAIEPQTSIQTSIQTSSSFLADLEGTLSMPELPDNTGFWVISTIMYLPVPPVSSNYPFEAAVYNSLSNSLFEYHQPVQGIICGHENAEIAPPPKDTELSLARLSDGYADSFLWVSADLLVFRPSKGAWLTGQIKLQTESHIALVVKGLWNASVPSKRLPKNWRWIPDRDDESLHEDGDIDLTKLRLGGAGKWVDGNGKLASGVVVIRARSFDITPGKQDGRSIMSIEATMLSDEDDKEMDKYDELSAPRISRRGRGIPGVRTPVLTPQIVPLKPQAAATAEASASTGGQSARQKKSKKKGKERAQTG